VSPQSGPVRKEAAHARGRAPSRSARHEGNVNGRDEHANAVKDREELMTRAESLSSRSAPRQSRSEAVSRVALLVSGPPENLAHRAGPRDASWW